MEKKLTPEETKVIDHTVALWNALILLPVEHGDDIGEARGHIHAIQNMIASRPVWRELNNVQRVPAAKHIIPNIKKDGH